MATVGQYLRELREQRKMSVEEVSRATRVPVASVERIETDRFDELPGEVFVRGMAGPDTPVVDGLATGVFAWRPTAQLVLALSDVFDRGEAS